MSKAAFQELVKARADLEEDLTTVVAKMVKEFHNKTGVGIEDIYVHFSDITIHEDLTKNYIVSRVAVHLAI